jgi:hypothetical protein
MCARPLIGRKMQGIELLRVNSQSRLPRLVRRS